MVLTGVALARPETYLVYSLTGPAPLAGATLLGVGFVVPSGIDGYREGDSAGP